MRRNVIIRTVVTVLIALLVLSPLSGGIAVADSTTPIPHAFYGELHTTAGDEKKI